MSAPGRVYHSPMHVLGILAVAERLDAPLEDADRLALWFHDAILDPAAAEGANEAASAELLASEGAALGLDPEVLARACESIRWTARHFEARIPEPHRLVLDLDLANLSESAEVFDRQAEAVEEESAHLPPPERARASLALFEALLARDAVYRTPCFAPREAAARANLERAIVALRERLGA